MNQEGLPLRQRFFKRLFDVVFSFLGIALSFPIIILAWIISSVETKSNGIFTQIRIGRYGKRFKVLKIKTMHNSKGVYKDITTDKDPRITRFGRIFRLTKIDELPQLINILLGQMSFVGPRPDVPGYADKLSGEDRIILELRPGITGPASIKYRNEQEILSKVTNPVEYNDTIIWPDKVKINLNYLRNYSFFADIKYILKTFL